MKKYAYLIFEPNIVSLSYCKKDKSSDYVFCIGVTTDNGSFLDHVEYERPTKKIKIPVQLMEVEEMLALCNHYDGGSQIKVDGLNGGGTLGVCINFNGKYRLLSAAHVLTEFDEDNIGKQISLRTGLKGNEPYVQGPKVEGHYKVILYDTMTERDPQLYSRDLAWASVTERDAPSSQVRTIGDVTKIDRPKRNNKVVFYGGSSQKLFNDTENIYVESTSTLQIVSFLIRGKTRYGYFQGICSVNLTKEDYDDLEEGDSGTAILDQRNVVGILMSKCKYRAREQDNVVFKYRAYFCKLCD